MNSDRLRPKVNENRPFEELDPMMKFILEFGEDATTGAYWKRHGDAYLEKWTAENPGTRPWWWWHFRGPREPFRILNLTPLRPSRDGNEVRESEAAYLHRHGLLLPAERELWDAGVLPKTTVVFASVLPKNRVMPVADPGSESPPEGSKTAQKRRTSVRKRAASRRK